MSLRETFRSLKRQLRLTHKERRHELVGPANLWRQRRDFQINFLINQGLLPSDVLCDLGCGTLRGGIPIIEFLEPEHYYGIDSRAVTITEAWEELREEKLAHKRPKLFTINDLGNADLNNRFDIVWAFSVLLHMPDHILDKALSFVSQHIKKEGVFFANVNIGSGVETAWLEFPVVWRSFEFYQARFSDFSLDVSDMGKLTSYGPLSGAGIHDSLHMLKARPSR